MKSSITFMNPETKYTIDAIVLLSGGLDSTVAMAELLNLGNRVLALTFHYGQRAWERELASTRQLAAFYGVEHHIIDLPWLAELLPSALTPTEKLAQPEVPVTDR